jgi:hypothetical protein
MPATRTTRRTAAQRAEDLRLRDALKAGWSEKELVAIGFEIAGAAKPGCKSRTKKSLTPAAPKTPAVTPPYRLR